MTIYAVIYLVIQGLGLGILLAKHGQPREDRYNVFLGLLSSALMIWLLWAGGFFS